MTYSYRARGDHESTIEVSIERRLCSKEKGTWDLDIGGPALEMLYQYSSVDKDWSRQKSDGRQDTYLIPLLLGHAIMILPIAKLRPALYMSAIASL